jgi:hypothetical protein
MAANPRIEGLDPQRERDPAPPHSVASPSSEPTAESGHIDEPENAASPEELIGGQAAESRHAEIARAAYFLAEARGFEPGHELDDWIAAEQQIRSH